MNIGFLFIVALSYFVNGPDKLVPQPHKGIKTCRIFQYSGIDSFNAKVTLTITYNDNGQITTEKYVGYKTTLYDGSGDGICSYFYDSHQRLQRMDYNKDTMNPQKSIHNPEDGTRRQSYLYDSSGKLIYVKSSSYLRKVMPAPPEFRNKWRHSYSLFPSWDKGSIMYYAYDSINRLIDKNAPKAGQQNHYTFKYNTDNKLIEEDSYTDTTLLYRQLYTYSDSRYSNQVFWVDYPKGALFKFKLDKKGREVEDLALDDNGKIYRKIVTHYNDNNLIVKKICYNSDNKPVLTHIYQYYDK